MPAHAQAKRTQSHSTSTSSSTSNNRVSRASSRNSSSLKRLTWGIFEVAYEKPQFSLWIYRLGVKYEPVLAAAGLFLTLFRLNFYVAAQYFLSLLLCAVSPGLSMFLAHSVLNIIGSDLSFDSLEMGPASRERLSFFVIVWLSCGLLTSIASRHADECRELLGGHLRAYYLPRLVDARLKMISQSDTHGSDINPRLFPGPWSFGSEVPGWNIISKLTTRMMDVLALICEMAAFASIIQCSPAGNAQTLGLIGACVLLDILFSPSNGAEGAGYTFWTKNRHYQRLLSLHSIVFDDRYREHLVKDELMDYLSSEYKSSSSKLGVVKSNTLALACHLAPPWYWSVARLLLSDYPMALYALLSHGSFTMHTVVSIAALQYSIHHLSKTAAGLRASYDAEPTFGLLQQAHTFLNTVTVEPLTREVVRNTRLPHSDDNRPSSKTDEKHGMAIELRNVSSSTLRRLGDGTGSSRARINAGEFVLVVGAKGSGKTSLLKMMAALSPNDSGRLFFGRQDIRHLNHNILRQKIAFVSGTDSIYPLSVSENIAIGLGSNRTAESQSDMERAITLAAEMAGCLGLLDRVGWNTVLEPCQIVGQSIQGCGNGDIGTSAFHELRKNDYSQYSHTISTEDRGRLTAARGFMRSLRDQVKLVVIDALAPSEDPESENDLVRRFLSLRKGKTMIVVANGFRSLAHEADRILCMEGGSIVQNGRHEELVKQAGPYKDLYGSNLF
ncbi:P-loop containing nucleoside triphosphate hydrolase protein [Coprinopsis marcescibilis]|uniref:P-loop containing nucleoside triphosphate hydrolase protein n=1 Tax=Coprinopsis marcescibilis TaxID=230819 RepID=A0A5C3KFF6_COPMA|nr:P-loop containing nucleoside triphosphate hydrolase protein [Coprinopsis marcescibilis]